MENPELDLPEQLPFNDPRRKTPRWYLHDGSTPLEFQSCGIVARLMVSGLLFDKNIGRVVIKDIGPGGVGFLTPSRFVLPDIVVLSLSPKIALECHITYRRAIGQSLCFYGARWAQPDSVDLSPVLTHWRHCFMEPAEASSDPAPADPPTAQG